MNRLRGALNPKIAKIIVDSYPVVKNRKPLWFFQEELKRTNSGPIKKNRIRSLWHDMEPESKRKYFNMAEFDEFRYKEQKSLWIAEVGSLLAKYGTEIAKHPDMLPDAEKTDLDYQEALKKFERSYEHMIQSESTKTLYRDAIDRVFKLRTDTSADEVIFSVPEDLRPILERPRRPLTSFMQYASDNKITITEFRKQEHPKSTFMHAASLMWYQLPEEERAKYERDYKKAFEDYCEALKEFNESLEGGSNHIELASKEKRAFRKSLRRRLRESNIVPVNVRNAFNFYVKEHHDKSLSELTEMWHNLPDEEKLRYKKMNEEDSARYYQEREVYREFVSEMLTRIDGKQRRTRL